MVSRTRTLPLIQYSIFLNFAELSRNSMFYNLIWYTSGCRKVLWVPKKMTSGNETYILFHIFTSAGKYTFFNIFFFKQRKNCLVILLDLRKLVELRTFQQPTQITLKKIHFSFMSKLNLYNYS